MVLYHDDNNDGGFWCFPLTVGVVSRNVTPQKTSILDTPLWKY